MWVFDYIHTIFNMIVMFIDGHYNRFWYRRREQKNITTDNEENINKKVVVVTGGSMGMGKAAAREFAKRGAIVVIGDVNLKEGNKTVEEIKEETGNSNVSILHLDLSDMDSVVEFAKKVSQDHPKIKILLNNAGLGGAPNNNNKTKDGFNLHMAVNHLGHFLLTNLLLNNLKAETKSRVVSMSSSMQLCQNLDIDDLMMDKSGFGFQNCWPYCNTKFCNALFIKELGKRLEHTSVKTYALCPGIVNTTIFGSSAESSASKFKSLMASAGIAGISPEKAAFEYIMFCALDKSIENETGKMYKFRQHFGLANKRLNDKDKLAKALWDKSAQLVKLDERLSKMKA